MQQLRQVVVVLQMAPIRNDIVMPLARRLFDEDGRLMDPAYDSRAAGVLDQLVWWARALRSARI